VDFLSAPRHLTRLLDNRALRMLIMPGRAYMRAVAVAARAPLKAVTKIVGAEMVLDTVVFLRAFEGMEAGIRNRAKRVLELFAEPSTAFVLVVAPRQDVIDEGRVFARSLGESNIPVQALIVNRLHPHFDAGPAKTPPVAPGGKWDPARRGGNAEAFVALESNWEEPRAVAEGEETRVAALVADVAPAPVARVPLLEGDVHDLDGVQSVAVTCSDRLSPASARPTPQPWADRCQEDPLFSCSPSFRGSRPGGVRSMDRSEIARVQPLAPTLEGLDVPGVGEAHRHRGAGRRVDVHRVTTRPRGWGRSGWSRFKWSG
jgi:anion-transporting  ArsA/GET3 family ATPase